MLPLHQPSLADFFVILFVECGAGMRRTDVRNNRRRIYVVDVIDYVDVSGQP